MGNILGMVQKIVWGMVWGMTWGKIWGMVWGMVQKKGLGKNKITDVIYILISYTSRSRHLFYDTILYGSR